MGDNRNERSQGRAQNEAQRRRRRGDEDFGAQERMPIPPEVKARLEAEGRIPRWVNDEGNRIHRFTVQDDYDKVEGVEPVPVGTDKNGQPIMAHLLAKPREFVEEDRARMERKRQDAERAMFERADDNTRTKAGRNPQPGTAERYVAPETSFRRGNQILED